MTSPNNIDDAHIAALLEEAFQWLIGLANIPEDAIIPAGGNADPMHPSNIDVTFMAPEYEGDHRLLLQLPLETMVSG